ncbi:NAD(P)/FAD-dependent oxidoreductase [bacterium]|nr:NAD(P)/FAD-dependent oxidoreductase [bacterium]
MKNTTDFDVIIIGAGASGLMCALVAGQRARRVLVLDHSGRPGRKILASGGGKCNFSNYSIVAGNYISQNEHFCKSAIKRYGVYDFLELLYKHDIAFEERENEQLFCTGSSAQIVNMLLDECKQVGVEIKLNTKIEEIRHSQHYSIYISGHTYTAESLVIATGSIAYPQIGATGIGYEIARQFDMSVISTRPGLTPLIYKKRDYKRLHALSGISLDVSVQCKKNVFNGALLFTHRGISGPAVLQISNLWQEGMMLSINLLPKIDLKETLMNYKSSQPRSEIRTLLSKYLPKKVVSGFVDLQEIGRKTISELTDAYLEEIANGIHNWHLQPAGVEGFEKAEICVGGVDVNGISSKTFESVSEKGLYFIGEVLDVSGWLGGYNLHWAWASGWCAGQVV